MEVVNPAFDTIRIRDELTYHTSTFNLKSLSPLIVLPINWILEDYKLLLNYISSVSNYRQKHFWIKTDCCSLHTWATERQQVKGYLIYEWWMSHKYGQNSQFPSPLFKMMRAQLKHKCLARLSLPCFNFFLTSLAFYSLCTTTTTTQLINAYFPYPLL